MGGSPSTLTVGAGLGSGVEPAVHQL